jgi:membrane protein DedA with SNARE-associated domain
VQETNIIIESMGALTYGGLFLVALMSNMLIPVPEEIMLLISGYLTGTGTFNYFITAGIFIVGMFISDIVLFYLSRRGNKYILKLQEKIKSRNLMRSEEYIKNNIKKIIFFSRFLVYIRFIGPVLSGSVKTKWSTFLFYDFIALLIYVPLVLFIGNYFHKNISAVISGVSSGKNVILIIFGLIALFLMAKLINKKFIRNLSSYIPTIIPGLSKENKEE